jgi:L-fuculose-phosphate aldolase
VSASLRHESVRDEIARTGRSLEHEGLVTATAGNLSARVEPDAIAITPTSIPYPRISAADVVICDLAGNVIDGERRPSSETPFHTAIYRARADVAGVVHTHSPYATVLAIMRRPIPAIHYVIASFGVPEIPVVPYETYGSHELAAQLERVAQSGTKGALLANHGAVAFDESLEDAATLASLLEFLAAAYYRAISAGVPVVLPNEEIDRVIQRYKTHGQPKEAAASNGAGSSHPS